MKNICSPLGYCVYTLTNGTIQAFSLFKPTSLIYDIFVASGIYFLSLCFFMAPFAFYVKQIRDEAEDYADDDEDEDYSDDDEDEDDEDYESKYFKELEAMPDKELSAEELKQLAGHVLTEETPKGAVCMSYNTDTGVFEYYTDHFATINYELLDSIARLFTITFNCKQICVNYRAELEKGEKHMLSEVEFDKREQERIKAKENEVKEKQRSVFATFKTYNKKNGNNVAKKYYVITENANRFKYKGKMDDYTQREKAKAVKADNTSCNTISYSEYKQLSQQSLEVNKKMD